MRVLLIPPFSIAVALIWNAWHGRDRRAASPVDSVANFRRSMRALAPTPQRRSRPLASHGAPRRPR